MTRIYTIGYEATDIKSFIHTLRAHGVTCLADVRALPLSRKVGFSKTKLALYLQNAGISYAPFKALGDPKPGREAARAGNYDEFMRIYTSHLNAPAAQDALAVLAQQAAAQTTCLMCYERDPSTCHRKVVTDALEARFDFSVQHLIVNETQSICQKLPPKNVQLAYS